MKKVIVIRYGHRPARDQRMTTHIALIARALGADGMIMTDVADEKIESSIRNVNENWGSNFFIEMGIKWRALINKIKENNDLLIHLTMYGLRLDEDIIDEIRGFNKNVYIFVGSQKVPSIIYNLADYNISITNQPQSECGALAIFLDRLFKGKNLYLEFENAKFKIIPARHGKKVELNR